MDLLASKVEKLVTIRAISVMCCLIVFLAYLKGLFIYCLLTFNHVPHCLHVGIYVSMC